MEESDEGGESLAEWDGLYTSPMEQQGATVDSEACDPGGVSTDGVVWKSVDVKEPVSTDGRQLDDVTHCGVWMTQSKEDEKKLE